MFTPISNNSQGYEIAKSLRFRSSATAYLNRTPAGAGNQKVWTWSGRVKRGTLGSAQILVGASAASDNSYFLCYINASDQLVMLSAIGAVTKCSVSTTAVFRDPAAWYHVVFYFDAVNTTARIYVNGVSQTLTVATAVVNENQQMNAAITHRIGRDVRASFTVSYFDGYITEVHFIDGQALDPSYFGQTDALTGQWVPKRYGGSYGTNGYYLNFVTGTSTTTLGDDASGNNNDWTLNNISLTSGVTYDWMDDTPTNNFCVLNPLDVSQNGSAGTITNGNLQRSDGTATNTGTLSTFWPTSGKWYWEVTATSVPAGLGYFLALRSDVGTVGVRSDGNVTGASGSGFTYTSGDVLGVAVDVEANSVACYKNGVLQTTLTPTTAITSFSPQHSDGTTTASTQTSVFNFGQRPFTYTPPTGYKALCTKNLPTTAIKNGKKYFDAKTRTGTGATATTTGIGFQPDFIWTKNRAAVASNVLIDAVRGGNRILNSDLTNAETTAGAIQSFNSDGYTYESTGAATNQNAVAYIDWLWKESVTSGFDIVTYTGTGVAHTVAHDLGDAPAMMIIKNRSSGLAWLAYHQALGATNHIVFNTTAAAVTSSGGWNNTAPTSSVFTVGTGTSVNENGSLHVAYLFAEVAGFSKFGSYTGNGSADGPFVNCGFKPRWIMIKRTDTGGAGYDWFILDTARDTHNVSVTYLRANLTNAEATLSAFLDVTSNGFKLRDTSLTINGSGGTFIYAAFAEAPLKYATAR